MAEPISSLLRRSVEHLAEEVPDSYRVLLAEIGAMVIEIDVADEVFSVRGGRRLDVSDGTTPDAGTRIATSRAAIIDVIDARVGLADAVETGTVRVQGSLDDVLRAHDTLLAYVHAAARAPSQPGLLDALRGNP